MTVVDRNLKILKLGTQTNCLNLQANSNNTKKKKPTQHGLNYL